MAEPPRQPDSKPHATPRWVKMMAIISIVAVLVIGILLLTVGGHGPGRHSGGGGEQQSTGGVGGPADASDQAGMRSQITIT